MSMESGDRRIYSTCSIQMRFKPKDVENAVQLLLSVKGRIGAKRGCHSCEVGMEAADTGLVHYREKWESGEAFLKHVQSEEFRRVLIAVDLCCEEPRVVVGNLSGRSGMSHLLKMRENAWVRIAADGSQTVRKGRAVAAEEQVPLTLVCVSCEARQDIRVPSRRGVQPGTYHWECLDCQGKDHDSTGAGHPRKRSLRGEGGKQTPGREQI